MTSRKRISLLPAVLILAQACAAGIYNPEGQGLDGGAAVDVPRAKPDLPRAAAPNRNQPRKDGKAQPRDAAQPDGPRKDASRPDWRRPDARRPDLRSPDLGAPDLYPSMPDLNSCGNGKLDPGETCDRAIAKGLKGACPTSCPSDGKVCTADKLVGTLAGCTVKCVHQLLNPCCGDGKRAGAEQCDDGNLVDTDLCTNKCSWPGGPLLITEVVTTPTAGEMVEIFNPTGKSQPLADIFLADLETYHLVVEGKKPAHASDFIARFPSTAAIGPGQFQLVALAGATNFAATHGRKPHYELVPQDPAVPDMVAPVTGAIGSAPTLTNSGEVLVLFHWNGYSDRVKDLDYLIWGGATPVNKSGVCTDGPDPDIKSTCYLGDTGPTGQSRLTAHATGGSFHRCNFQEGTEKKVGGNGSGGHDETSEPLTATWVVNASTESKRTPGAGPPKGLCP